MTDLVRRHDERDPENIGDVLLEFGDETPTKGSDTVALREMWYFLRVHREARRSKLADVGWNGADQLAGDYESRNEWWNVIGDQYFRLLPNIVPPDERGGVWRFDDDGQERPAVPDDYVAPSDERVAEALREFETPRDQPVTAKSKIQIQRLYEHLKEHGSATADELKELYEPADVDRPSRTTAVGDRVLEVSGTSPGNRPELDQYVDAGAWFLEIGRPALAQLPGIDPPQVAGQPFRFIGVDPEEREPIAARPDPEEVLEESIATLDVGGRGEWTARRRETVRRMHEHLQENDGASREELVARIDARKIGYSSAGAFFDEIASDALASLPGTQTEDGDAWRYDREKATADAAEAAD